MDSRTGDASRVQLDRRTWTMALCAAYGVGLWTHLVHWRSGAREAHDVTFWAHWLRDSTLSVPLMLLAVMAATMAVGHRSSWWRVATANAAAIALALTVGVPFHAGIFGHAAHHGATTALPVAMTVEFLIDFPAGLLLGVVLFSATRRHHVWTQRQRRALGTVMLFGLGVVTVPTQAGAATPPSVCPFGAPIRTYNVTMINVNIPLNRWGDHDPAGKMYALNSQIPAIRAEELSRIVTPGLM
jgi:hypothetical protein